MNGDTRSTEEFWSVVVHLNEDVTRCTTGLNETAEGDTEGKSFWRRMHARAIFALIDSAVYGMTFHAYLARNRPDVPFSLEELTRLEGAYDFDEDSERPATWSRALTLDDIRFAFTVIARAHYCDYILPIHEPGWNLVKDILRIRNALDYAREPKESEVYDENIESLVDGTAWLLACCVDCFKGCAETLEAYALPGNSAEDEIVM